MLIELYHNRVSLSILDPKTNNTSAIVGVAVGVSILIILIIGVIIFVTYKKKYRWYPRMSLGFSNAMYHREIDESSYWFKMLALLIYYCTTMSWFYALFIFSLILQDLIVVLYNEKYFICILNTVGVFSTSISILCTIVHGVFSCSRFWN